MNNWEKWALGAILYGMTCACAAPSMPDTPSDSTRVVSTVLVRNNATAVPDLIAYTPNAWLVGDMLPGAKICLTVRTLTLWLEATDHAGFMRSTVEWNPLLTEGWVWLLTDQGSALAVGAPCP